MTRPPLPDRTFAARLPEDTDQHRAAEMSSPFVWRRIVGAGAQKTEPGCSHWNILRIAYPPRAPYGT